jgi:hypothetical protein
MVGVLVGDHDRGHIGKLVRPHPAFEEGEEAGIEQELLPLVLEEQAGVDVLGDLHGLRTYPGR